MGKIKSGVKRVTFYNPATGDSVQLNKVSPDSELTKSPITNETTQGLQYGGFEATFNVMFLESDGLSQLKTWLEGDTVLNAVAEGVDECVLFYESQESNFERGVGINARDGIAIHMAELIAVGDVDVNALTNVASKSDLWTGEADEVNFPVQGAVIGVSGTFASTVSGEQIVITVKDFAGATLQTETISVTGDSTFTGTLEITDADAYSVEVDFNTGGSGASVTDKTVRFDGKTDYVTY